jgi:Type IV minor pilin ComP, DNA uptake sequence receptor
MLMLGLRSFALVNNKIQSKKVFHIIFLSLLLVSCTRINSMKATEALEKFRAAQKQYFSANKQYGTVSQLMNANLFDRPIDKGEYYGYNFSIEINNDSYTITATPKDNNTSYFLSEDGIIRFGYKPDKLSKESPQAAFDKH